jgi:hypothetical protein
MVRGYSWIAMLSKTVPVEQGDLEVLMQLWNDNPAIVPYVNLKPYLDGSQVPR